MTAAGPAHPPRPPGHRQEATYSPQEVSRYAGNPFIEALPPIRTPEQAVAAMQRLVLPTPEQLASPSHIRMHEVEACDHFFQPLTPHTKLHEAIDRRLRCGYLHRNPLNPAFLAEMGTTLAALEAALRASDEGRPWALAGLARPPATKGRTLAVLGMSGVGKTQAIQAVLGTYPEVIEHPRLRGPFLVTTQLVHLTLTCPEDGTIKGLCFTFLEAVDRRLGTNYLGIYGGQAATLARLRVAMARISYVHGLGVLVIDEIQLLSEAKSGGAGRMLAFFKVLSETVGVPVVVVGTPDAGDVVGGDFPTARRHAGEQLFGPQPLWHAPGVLNPELRFFHERLFAGQFLRSPVPVDDAVVALMHELNQGVPALDVKLFVEAQQRALELGLEELSEDLLRAVHREHFGLLHGYLARMARGESPGDGYEGDLRQLMGRAASVPAKTAAKASSPVGSRRRRRTGDPGRPKSSAATAGGPATGGGGHEALSAAGLCRPIGAELMASDAGASATRPRGNACSDG